MNEQNFTQSINLDYMQLIISQWNKTKNLIII